MMLATTGPPVGIVNVAGDGVVTVQQAARLAGRPVGARSRWRRPGCSGRSSGAPGWPTSPTTRCSTSPSAGAWTPPAMRQVLHLEPRFTTRAAFEDFIAQAGTGLPGQAVLASVADSLAGTAAGVLSHAVPTSRSHLMAGRGAAPLRDGEGRGQARPRPAAGARTRSPPVPHEPAGSGPGAAARRCSATRQRRTRAPPPVERRRAPPGHPGCGGRDGEGGRPRRSRSPRRSTGPGRCPRSSAVRLGKAASGERSETRARRGRRTRRTGRRRTDAPALSSVPEPSLRRRRPRGAGPPARRPRSLSGIEELVHVAVAVLRARRRGLRALR